jgi:hypothetical protein
MPLGSTSPPSAHHALDRRIRALAESTSLDAKIELRKLLLPRVLQGGVPNEEVKLLIDTCSYLGDAACVDKVRSNLASSRF